MTQKPHYVTPLLDWLLSWACVGNLIIWAYRKEVTDFGCASTGVANRLGSIQHGVAPGSRHIDHLLTGTKRMDRVKLGVELA